MKKILMMLAFGIAGIVAAESSAYARLEHFRVTLSNPVSVKHHVAWRVQGQTTGQEYDVIGGRPWAVTWELLTGTAPEGDVYVVDVLNLLSGMGWELVTIDRSDWFEHYYFRQTP